MACCHRLRRRPLAAAANEAMEQQNAQLEAEAQAAAPEAEVVLPERVRDPAERAKDSKPRKVLSMAESFLFEQDCFEVLLEEEGEEKVISVVEAMQADSISTKPLAASSQTEWNQGCLDELLPQARQHGACVFKKTARSSSGKNSRPRSNSCCTSRKWRWRC